MAKDETPKEPPKDQRQIDREEELARQKKVTDALAKHERFTPEEFVSSDQFWGVLRWRVAECASVLATRAETELYLEEERKACRKRLQPKKEAHAEETQGPRQDGSGSGAEAPDLGRAPDRPGAPRPPR